MAQSNLERVGSAMESLRGGLRPFVEREMRAVLGDRWIEAARQSFGQGRAPAIKGTEVKWDAQALLTVMWDQWEAVFKKILGRAERTLVSELREVRNKWAHQEAFSTDDAYRALDSTVRLLQAVSAPEADEVEKQKQELLRVRFEEQARRERRKVAVAPVEGAPAAGLKPWREVVTPHPDVASGRYQQAEFAADLWQVYVKEGVSEYRDPTEFFRRTYLTEGLRRLLVGALQRIAGKGGDPVIELQTNFGGGKTHSMLALYHLFSGTALGELTGVDSLLSESGVSQLPTVKRAVLVGTKIPPGQPQKKADGTVVKTLWGELAYQLGGKEGYAIVKEADQTATNPGDSLRKLFQKYAPCLILIDEWVAYARQLFHISDLPAGSFDTHFTFAQTLTEAAKAVPQTLLVVSIPVSEAEVGGEGGKAALDRLRNAIGRVHSPWRPASTEEGFEIVRRRLFQPIADPTLFVARDNVVRAFGDMYRSQHQEFPPECREGDYERRLKGAYPIHPELFDRLYKDWSSLERFQQTRGVLRLMAAVIHTLWEREDRSLVILPANIPVDDPAVQSELTRYLEDPWMPVIEKDVDGPHSLPLQLDRENPNLGRYSACRRVSRTIYLGSAPTLRAAHRGLEDRQVRLGCVQPGEAVATFGDALRRLTDRATYLYVDGSRFWYSTQPSVTRLAEDRALQYSPDEVAEEIRKRLRDEAKIRGDYFSGVHPCPSSGGDVPDELEARLVVLSPEFAHSSKDDKSPARQMASSILESRGASPRIYRNAIVFAAADKTRLADLEQAVRRFLAWKSIDTDHEVLNLDAFQGSQAKKKLTDSEETIHSRIPETYQWLLIPGQSETNGSLEWQDVRQQGEEALAIRAGKKLKSGELLMTEFSGIRLRMELDRVPLWRGDHVSVKQLVEDFAQYLYLPRLREPEVLLKAVRDGVARLTWQTETFAYADRWEPSKKRYVGLQAGREIRALMDGQSALVKPDVAAAQLEADRAAREPVPTTTPPTNGGQAQTSQPGTATAGTAQPTTVPPMSSRPRRFHGSVTLDAARLSRDAGKVAEEIVQHLIAQVGATVDITVEINARSTTGFPENVVRTVTENCRTLRFLSQGFEDT